MRRKLFGILCHVFDNEPAIDVNLQNEIKEVLLSALADPSNTNRKLMFEFWGHSTRLKVNIVERMNDLLTKLFTTKYQHLWLHYASFLLLEPMRTSADFTELISHRPLSECQFVECEIGSEWGMTQNFGMTPLFPMYTLGHNFVPAPIHAGGLRYHGAGVIVSQLLKDNLIEAVSHDNMEVFDAGVTFARSEGIIPAPEATHGIATAIAEAKKCKEEGTSKTILFNLCGHGNFDMTAYQDYFENKLTDHNLTDEEIRNSLSELTTPAIP